MYIKRSRNSRLGFFDRLAAFLSAVFYVSNPVGGTLWRSFV